MNQPPGGYVLGNSSQRWQTVRLNDFLGWLKAWWAWSTKSGWWRKLVGFGVPAFVALIVISAIVGGSEPAVDDSGGGEAPEAVSRDNADGSPTEPPAPTSTLEPTQPPPPTATPTPIVLTGTGPDVRDITQTTGLLRISGNAAGRYFGVTGFNAEGRQTELYVNTTEPYEGIRPLDFQSSDKTTRLQIEATGVWQIEILPLSAARTLTGPGTISGSGDEVVLVTGTVDTATITGNQAGRYFGVTGWGSRFQLLANTTDPYNGKVILDKSTKMIDVRAVGPWTITLP